MKPYMIKLYSSQYETPPSACVYTTCGYHDTINTLSFLSKHNLLHRYVSQIANVGPSFIINVEDDERMASFINFISVCLSNFSIKL